MIGTFNLRLLESGTGEGGTRGDRKHQHSNHTTENKLGLRLKTFEKYVYVTLSQNRMALVSHFRSGPRHQTTIQSTSYFLTKERAGNKEWSLLFVTVTQLPSSASVFPSGGRSFIRLHTLMDQTKLMITKPAHLILCIHSQYLKDFKHNLKD